MISDVMKHNVEQVKTLASLLPDKIHQAEDILAETFRWNYINEGLPQLHEKDYIGVAGWKQFFNDLAALTGGTFSVSLKDAYPLGSEFVVVHANPSMRLDGQTIETDAAVVWRLVEGKVVEAWDIPGLNSALRFIEAAQNSNA